MGINADIYIIIGVKYTHELCVFVELRRNCYFLSDAVARQHRIDPVDLCGLLIYCVSNTDLVPGFTDSDMF